MNCYLWIKKKIRWHLPKTHSPGWKEIQFLSYFHYVFFQGSFQSTLDVPPVFLSHKSLLGAGFPSPVDWIYCFLPNQEWAWGAWSEAGSWGPGVWFLGFSRHHSFFASCRFPEVCPGSKVVLSTIWRPHHNSPPGSGGIMVFFMAFAFTSPYSPK